MSELASETTRNEDLLNRSTESETGGAQKKPEPQGGFHGILFSEPVSFQSPDTHEEPEVFRDLNLDQIVETVTANWADYDLKPYFYAPLGRIDAIRYRHAIFRDLENPLLLAVVRAFAQRMRETRANMKQADKLHYSVHKGAWLLRAVETYCGAIENFTADLSRASLTSPGFLALRDYLASYRASSAFISLCEETRSLQNDLSKLRYCIHIHDGGFTVRNYDSEPDYGAEVERTFQKFKMGAAKDYKVDYPLAPAEMNHIEAKILEFVALLNPAIFAKFDTFCTARAQFIDEAIARFDREVHFYLAYLEYISELKRSDLQFCYPDISREPQEIHAEDGFDLALAHKLREDKRSIVSNSFHLTGPERIIVVTGPNQGGKTTFARMFGQLHYLASIGCPVPGRHARLFLFDRIFTHFEREEEVENLRGKLEDDLTRILAILERATSRSIIVMNEIFTSTTLEDEIYLSRQIMERITTLGALSVWVTFAEEMASYNSQTVSMVSSVDPEDPTSRTFKVVRRPADGLAHAVALAEKYRVTYDCIRERLKS